MELLIYLLKASACTAFFLSFYFFGLRKLTFFKWNRIYLLGALILSLLIPVMNLEIKKEIPETKIELVTAKPLISKETKPIYNGNMAIITVSNSKDEIDWMNILIITYFSVSFILLLNSTTKIARMMWIIQTYPYQQSNGLKVIIKNEGFTNCSFLNYVFINEKNITEQDRQTLLAHEVIHIKKFHSLDKIFMMIYKLFFWFNPLIYYYDRFLEMTHEFEVDEIMSTTFNSQQYANLLLSMATNHKSTLANSFAKSPVTDRIKMMFNSKSNQMKKLIYLTALPICLGLVGLFGIEVVYAQIESDAISKELPKNSVVKYTKNFNYIALNEDSSKSTVNLKKQTPTADSVIHKEVKNVEIVDKFIYDNIAENELYNSKLNDEISKLVIANLITYKDNITANAGCNVISVQSDDQYTIVNFEFTSSRDDDWALLNKEIFIQANNDMKHFQYVKSEGIPLAPNRHDFKKVGEKLNFKIYFEKVPASAKSIDIIERAGHKDFFNFYNVAL